MFPESNVFLTERINSIVSEPTWFRSMVRAPLNSISFFPN